jgi:tetratricopeptide (TPR) repeat protein
LAEGLLARDSASLPARALVGEIQLELGAYREAARTFGTLLTARTDLAVAPRYARWEEIRGRPAEARRLLREALKEASRRHGMPRSQLAWFHWRLGDLALRNGRLGEAQGEFERGLQREPEDHRLLDGLARVAAARGRWREAIALGERAITASLDPATLGLLALSHEALGDRAGGAEYERVMSVAVSGQSGTMHRAWSLYLLDRGRSVPQILARSREEIRTRPDVYGWDLLAWALYRSGMLSAALRAAERALAMGTRDASLYYHAGTVAAAAGEPARATQWLEEALAINPRWHPTQPDEARETLRRLRFGRPVP